MLWLLLLLAAAPSPPVAKKVQVRSELHGHLLVDDLRTHQRLHVTAKLVGTLAWASDNRTLFYTTEDLAKRSDRVWRHALGGKSALVMHESDEHFSVDIHLSADEAQVLMVL